MRTSSGVGVQVTSPPGLVVLHKFLRKMFFRLEAKRVPGGGQVSSTRAIGDDGRPRFEIREVQSVSHIDSICH